MNSEIAGLISTLSKGRTPDQCMSDVPIMKEISTILRKSWDGLKLTFRWMAVHREGAEIHGLFSAAELKDVYEIHQAIEAAKGPFEPMGGLNTFSIDWGAEEPKIFDQKMIPEPYITPELAQALQPNVPIRRVFKREETQ